MLNPIKDHLGGKGSWIFSGKRTFRCTHPKHSVHFDDSPKEAVAMMRILGRRSLFWPTNRPKTTKPSHRVDDGAMHEAMIATARAADILPK